MKVMQVPDRITPVVGWRVWRVDGYRLRSMYTQEFWAPGLPTKAYCRSEGAIAGYGSAMVANIAQHLSHSHSMSASMPPAPVKRDALDPQTSLPLVGRGQSLVPDPRHSRFSFEYASGGNLVVSGEVTDIVVPRDLASERIIPGPGCTCGLYATTDKLYAAEYLGDGTTVIGRVALWGNVIEHGSGYRAEYGYPLALWCPGNRLKEYAVLLAEYNVPIHDIKELGLWHAPEVQTTANKPTVAADLPLSFQEKAVVIALMFATVIWVYSLVNFGISLWKHFFG